MIRELHFQEEKAAIDIKTLFKGSRLIPFFGSGFTKGCKSKNGRLPDAAQLVAGIKGLALKSDKLSMEDRQDIENMQSLKSVFSLLASDEYISKKVAQTYFTNTFSGTDIVDRDKVDLLRLDWPHVFSFNIDDGIERANRSLSTLKPNRKTSLEYISSHRCLFKIHGDITEYSATEDEKLIFTWRDYVDSLEENKAMLNFLANEAQHSAFLFIGCSLDTELDLMHLSKKNSFDRSIFLKKGRLKLSEKLALADYGIQQVIYFDEYAQIYSWLVDTLKSETRVIPTREIRLFDDELDSRRAISVIANGGPLYEIVDDVRIGHVSSTFPLRSKLKEAENLLRDNEVILLTGRRFSGKTLFLFQLISGMSEYGAKYFGSAESFNPLILQQLAGLENHLFVFDSNYLDSESLKEVLDVRLQKSSRIIICASMGDAERVRFRLADRSRNLVEVKLQSALDASERSKFNDVLGRCGLPLYKDKENLLNFAFRCYEEYEADLPKSALFVKEFRREIYPVLILLAAFGKATEHQISCVLDSFDVQAFVRKNDRIFEVEEMSGRLSLVCSASAWLLKEINSFIEHDSKAHLSFVYVIASLHSAGYVALANDLVRVDKINEISGGTKSRIFIKKIYEGIFKIYSDDSHYWLQRAKADLLTARKLDEIDDGIKHARKVRADHSHSKNQTYYSATLVLAQLYAKGYSFSKKSIYAENFVSPCIESLRNYEGNKRYLDDFLGVHDVKNMVKVLGNATSVAFLPKRNEIKEICNFFNAHPRGKVVKKI